MSKPEVCPPKTFALATFSTTENNIIPTVIPQVGPREGKVFMDLAPTS